MTSDKSFTSNSVAVVPARVGSRGLPRKNFLDFAGKTLCEHAVDQALRVARNCILSTDDQDTLRSMKTRTGVLTNHRAPELASDNASMYDVLKNIIEFYALEKETVILLQPTTPLRTDKNIIDLIQLFDSGKYDLVMSISETDNSFLKAGFFDGKKIKSVNKTEHCFSNRQDLPKLYRPNGAAFVFNAKWLLRNKSFSTENLGAMMIDPISSIDIDNKQDFELAQKIFIEKNQNPKAIFTAGASCG